MYVECMRNNKMQNNFISMFISSLIVLFSYGKVKDIFLEIMIKFHRGGLRGKRGYGGEVQNEDYFFPKFPLLSKIQILYHKLLVRQISNYHHCNWHVQKPICRDFQVILNSSSWSKQLCVYLRNKYVF